MKRNDQTKSYRKAYDGLAGAMPGLAEWRNTEGPTLRQRLDVLARMVGDGMRVIEFGCGTGSMIGQLAKVRRLGEGSIGYDPDASAIDLACGTFAGVRFDVCEIGEPLPEADGRFDAVICSEVLEHVFDTRQVLSEFHRVLKPDGLLCVTVPYHGWLKAIALLLTGRYSRHYHDPYSLHIRYYDRESLTRALRDHGFRVTYFNGIGRAPFLWLSMFVAARKA
ncbi:MAG: class I SAM-dependent methyltransferase [Planctomycetes bacterium]|nr:class I SAM-dependent methyltransferase [Planctomycetota bacterium]